MNETFWTWKRRAPKNDRDWFNHSLNILNMGFRCKKIEMGILSSLIQPKELLPPTHLPTNFPTPPPTHLPTPVLAYSSPPPQSIRWWGGGVSISYDGRREIGGWVGGREIIVFCKQNGRSHSKKFRKTLIRAIPSEISNLSNASRQKVRLE